MKIVYIDTEFTGEHALATLVSIGLVAVDGRELYVTLNDYDERQVTDWFRENVLSMIKKETSVSKKEAYEIINKWIKNLLEDAFIHTTNTDGYHLTSGCSADRILEVHGSMWRLQCLNVCSHRFWKEETVPLCNLDLKSMKASKYPTCPKCQGIARPHILMFGDMEYVGHLAQEANFRNFVQKDIDLVFLVGSSGAVPTNDYIALELKNKGAKLININPDLSTNKIAKAKIFLPLKSREAFVRINKLIS